MTSCRRVRALLSRDGVPLRATTRACFRKTQLWLGVLRKQMLRVVCAGTVIFLGRVLHTLPWSTGSEPAASADPHAGGVEINRAAI